MVLPDRALKVVVQDWDDAATENVNPASVDLTLGEEAVIVDWPWWQRVLYALTFGRLGRGRVRRLKLPPEGLTLRPGQMALLHSREYVRVPEWAAGILLLKSSRGREGYDHAFAGWFDPGFEGQAVFEVYSPARPLRLIPGQRFAQLVLLYMAAPPERPYRGNYQGQRGAVGSVWEMGQNEGGGHDKGRTEIPGEGPGSDKEEAS